MPPLVLDGTNGVSGVDGTASNPAIEGTDSNTGIFYPAADTVAIGTGGTERLRVDSAGNAGLGVTPSSFSTVKAIQLNTASTLMAFTNEFDIGQNIYYNAGNKYITTGAATLYAQTGGQHQWFNAPSGTAGNAITFTQAMTLDASGNLGLGTTSPLTRMHVQVSALSGYTAVANSGLLIERGNGPAALNIASPNTESGFIWFADQDSASVGNIAYNHPSNFMSFQTNGAERARITSGGNLLVGKTATDGAVVGVQLLPSGASTFTRSGSTNATSTLDVYSTGAGAYRFYVGMDGTVNATNTTISAISDQRLKENIRDLDVGLNAIMTLKPRKFDWKEGKGKNIKGDRGWIAQEFEQVFPDMIDTWKDEAPEGEEPYKSVRADLIPVLVKAIQEQQAMIEELKAKVAALENA